jgi:putative ABC transport system substrate-binding protein
MRRREFITLVGGAAAWPLGARAQQPAATKWRIGTLTLPRRLAMLRQGLRELGYVEGANLVIDVRPADKVDQLAALSAELVALKPDVIVPVGTQAVQAVQRATNRIPIVMFASDPVGTHLVASLAHPGGNSTGVSIQSPELSGKRIEMLRNVAGDLSLLAVLWKPDDPPAEIAFKETQDAASAMHLQLLSVEARDPDDLTPAFKTISKGRPKGLVILTGPVMSFHVARIAEFALGLKLPSIYTDRSFPQAGGLMSYGPDFDALMKRTAIYVDRIFTGEKPADLPIEQPTKFELVINLKTAKALGLTVSPTLLALADEVID